MNNKCDEQTRRAMKRNICRKTKHDWGALLYLGEGVKEGISGQMAVKLRPEGSLLSHVPLPL